MLVREYFVWIKLAQTIYVTCIKSWSSALTTAPTRVLVMPDAAIIKPRCGLGCWKG